MPQTPLEQIKHWIQAHPGIFSLREDGTQLTLLENFSQKEITFQAKQIQEVVPKQNKLKPGEFYLILLLEMGAQLVLAQQGFVFPPDFSNTGPLPLPSQVYCMQDFQDLYRKLRHVGAEANRRREALDLIMILIAILDGARAVGLKVDEESRKVEDVLSVLEKGNVLADPHGG